MASLPVARVLMIAAVALGTQPMPAAGWTGGEGPLVGGDTNYRVQPGDSLSRVAARFGLDLQVLSRENGRAAGARLNAGQSLTIDNRHVVPEPIEDGILINVPQRILYLVRDGTVSRWYPVAVGRPDWPTMPGEFQITSTEHWPTWHVPASIQREMARLRQPVRKRVAPGPKNPLGEYWLGLSGSGCGIHGTNFPASIYRFLTHGCIRLHPDDLADLVGQVGIGTAVRIDYEPVLLCALDGGAVFLEIHPDVYCLAPDPRAAIGGLAARLGVAGRLDPGRVAQALELREGRARRVDALPLGASGTASPASGAPALPRRIRSTIPD